MGMNKCSVYSTQAPYKNSIFKSIIAIPIPSAHPFLTYILSSPSTIIIMTLGHSALLCAAAASVPDAPFIELAVGSIEVPEWRVVTFAQFNNHVQLMAQYWHRELSSLGLVPGDIVGFWVPGMSYVDMVQLMALFGEFISSPAITVDMMVCMK
jgi:hypothetical protein